MKSIILVYGVLLKDGKIFLLKRDVRGRGLPFDFIWEPPGGRVDKGETPDWSVIREFWEESGILVKPRYLLGSTRYDDRRARRNALFYLVEARRIGPIHYGDPEHSGHLWAPLNALPENLALTTIDALHLLKLHNLWDGTPPSRTDYKPDLFLPSEPEE